MEELKPPRQPSYARIRDMIREQIIAGDFEVEGRLPTELDLQKQFGVSRHTVRRALQDLVSEGLIQRFSGKGTYSTGLHREHPFVRVFGNIEDLLALVEKAHFQDEYTAPLLDVSPTTPLLHIERTYFDVSGRPVEFSVSEYATSSYKYRIDLHRAMHSTKIEMP